MWVPPFGVLNAFWEIQSSAKVVLILVHRSFFFLDTVAFCGIPKEKSKQVRVFFNPRNELQSPNTLTVKIRDV